MDLVRVLTVNMEGCVGLGDGWCVCVCVCLSICLSVCLGLCVCVCVCVGSGDTRQCVCVRLFIPCMRTCSLPLCVYVCVCVCVCVCVFIPVSVYPVFSSCVFKFCYNFSLDVVLLKWTLIRTNRNRKVPEVPGKPNHLTTSDTMIGISNASVCDHSVRGGARTRLWKRIHGG